MNPPSQDELPAGDSPLDYSPVGPAYDELLDLSGTVRGHWSDLWQALTQLGPAGLTDRSEQSQRLLRENGVTYNVYGAAQDQDRPWILDPVPLLVTAREHDHIARGLNQRARLLNEIARDLWGPQRLIESGRLPSAVLFRHPAFFTGCVGLTPPDGVFMHWYAAQLARGPTGEWLVLGDRSQGPSGVGYAIENRVVVGRALAQQFHQRNVLRLAQGFVALKHSLSRLAGRLADSPRIVLLTPGPISSKYFEDVYLARYLGYALVEGGDLTVRGDAVYLKTLGGLLPVHLILRRVADTDCDPLELRPDSQCGVPGLTQAVRAGRVIMANALGSGLLEAPLLQAFLPDLCRELVGEPLLLPAVETWWCGRPDDHAYVQAHLSQLLIREAFEHRGRRWAGWRMTATELADLAAQIRDDPGHFIAQAPLLPSTAPTWSDSRLQSWHLTLRIFAFHNGGAWQTLPGGLCRVAAQPDRLAESMAAGQRSKDVWVLSDGPVETITLLPERRPALQRRRTVTELPSRVAD
ncbi:MAG: circularly permuted type 2 ATP-grasp protein, partial [Planctomycetaceae bacterium]